MKKITFLIAMIMIEAIAVNAQNVWFEQDVRISENLESVFYTQIQYTHPLWEESGLSGSAYIATDYRWSEALLSINYQQNDISGGIGAGLELQQGEAGFRWAPWLKFAPMIYENESGVLEILSQWEFGNGKGNYWFSNSIIYKARTEEEIGGQVGLLYRRFYGVGPIGGITWRNLNRFSRNEDPLEISFNVAVLRDFETNRVNFTPIITISF